MEAARREARRFLSCRGGQWIPSPKRSAPGRVARSAGWGFSPRDVEFGEAPHPDPPRCAAARLEGGDTAVRALR